MHLALLWVWCRLAAAALIQLLAQELLYAACATLKKKKEKRGKKRERERIELGTCPYTNNVLIFSNIIITVFLGLHPQHVEVPRIGVKSEL